MANDSPYSIPQSDFPDVDYSYEPRLYQTLENAYLKIFKSAVGQSILMSFGDCSEQYFFQHFELQGQAARQAHLACQQAQSRKKNPANQLSAEDLAYREALRRKMSQRISAQPRKHFLKVVPHTDNISSYTYLGNQTIVRLPNEMAYNTDILAALLLHEMTIYFDSKNPTNLLSIIQDNNLNIETFNIDLQELWTVWNNPLVSEGLSVLRSYKQEASFLPALSPQVQSLLSNEWFKRLRQVKDQRSCALIVTDYIADVLMKDEDYLKYRWASSMEYQKLSRVRGYSASREEIIQQTQQDLKRFLTSRIEAPHINTSLCEFALIPKYATDGILLNHGPRPPIKPGNSFTPTKKDENELKDIRRQWDFYRDLKNSKDLKIESVKDFQSKVRGAIHGK